LKKAGFKRSSKYDPLNLIRNEEYLINKYLPMMFYSCWKARFTCSYGISELMLKRSTFDETKCADEEKHSRVWIVSYYILCR